MSRSSTSPQVSAAASDRRSSPSLRIESSARSTRPRQEARSADSCRFPSPRASALRVLTTSRMLFPWSAMSKMRRATALDVSERTVFRAKRRYGEEGLDEVLHCRNQVNRCRKLDDRAEFNFLHCGLLGRRAHLTAPFSV